MNNISVALIIISGLIYLLPTWAIYKILKNYNDKDVDFFSMQMHPAKYLRQYRKITKLKKGKTGPYYLLWIVSAIFAFLLLIMAVMIAILIK